MLNLLTKEQTAEIPVIILPESVKRVVAEAHAEACAKCAAYRPEPQRSGNLQVDLDTHLPSVGFDVDIAHFYNASSPANGPLRIWTDPEPQPDRTGVRQPAYRHDDSR